MYKETYGWSTDLELGNENTLETGVRNGFIRKVLGILAIQLLTTAVISGLIFGIESIKTWIYSNQWIFYLSWIISLVLICIIFCIPGVKDKYPQNMILLSLFTLAEGFLVGVICSTYNANSVLLALVITVGVTVGMALFAVQTKYDFTLLSGFLTACLLVLIMMSFMLIFLPNNQTLSIVYAGIGALIFCLYLVYDIQLIVGGRRYELGPDDYIPAAISLYLDIIMIFLLILRLIGGSGGSNQS